jgi:hypothetical protein
MSLAPANGAIRCQGEQKFLEEKKQVGKKKVRDDEA